MPVDSQDLAFIKVSYMLIIGTIWNSTGLKFKYSGLEEDITANLFSTGYFILEQVVALLS